MNKRFLYRLIPAIISAVVFYIFIQKIDAQHLAAWSQALSHAMTPVQKIALIIAVLLVMSHPLLESLKWQNLLSTLGSVSLRQSWSMVMRGMASTLLMPSRSGDFIGKLYGVPREHWTAGFALSGVGNMLQLSQTLLWGSVSLIWYLTHTSVIEQLHFGSSRPMLTGMVLLALLIFVIFRRYKNRIKKTQAYQTCLSAIQTVRSLPSSVLVKVTVLSALRYFIFITQYFLIFYALGADILWSQVLLAQSAIYLCLAILPHTMIMDIALRAPLSVMMYAVFGQSAAVVLLAAYSLYFLNILLPALIGIPFYKSKESRKPILQTNEKSN